MASMVLELGKSCAERLSPVKYNKLRIQILILIIFNLVIMAFIFSFCLSLNPSPGREGLEQINIILLHPFDPGRRGRGMRLTVISS
jgi:hypothetical protein